MVDASASASVNNVGDSSSDEDSTLENNWQRTTLKGSDIDSPPAKLGEVVAGLHILLIAKIL